MGAEVSGIQVRGWSHTGREDFTSIQGFSLWVDPRVNTTINPTNSRITNIQERSELSFSWNRSLSGAAVTLGTDGNFKYINSANTALLFSVNNGLYSDLNFLVNGSPFSLYYIFRVEAGSTGGSNYYRPLGNTMVSQPGNQRLRITKAVTGTNRTITFNIYNDAYSSVLSLSAGAHPVWEHGQYYLVEINHRGYNVTGNDAEIYVSDILKGTANWSGAPGSNDFNGIHLGAFNGSSTGRLVTVLAFNHTGKTETDINSDRNKIRAIIATIYGDLLSPLWHYR